jgi:hypothetical protein
MDLQSAAEVFMRRFGGTVTAAAKAAGTSRTTFNNILATGQCYRSDVVERIMRGVDAWPGTGTPKVFDLDTQRTTLMDSYNGAKFNTEQVKAVYKQIEQSARGPLLDFARSLTNTDYQNWRHMARGHSMRGRTIDGLLVLFEAWNKEQPGIQAWEAERGVSFPINLARVDEDVAQRLDQETTLALAAKATELARQLYARAENDRP